MEIEDESAAIGADALRTLSVRHRPALTLAVVVLVLEGLCTLSIPWFAGRFVDGIQGLVLPYALSIQQLLLFWAIVLLLVSLLRLLSNYLIGHAGEQLLFRLRSRLFDRLQSLPMRYFHGRKPGETLTLLTADASLFSRFVSNAKVTVLPSAITLLAMLIFMYLLDPYIALVSSLFILCLHLVIKGMSRSVVGLSQQLNEVQEQTLSSVEENLVLLPEIKSSVSGSSLSGRLTRGNLRLMDLNSRRNRKIARNSLFVSFLAAAGAIIFLSLSANSIEQGELLLGDFASLILLALLLNKPLTDLLRFPAQQQVTNDARDRLIKIFSVMPEPPDTGTEVLRSVQGKVEFKNVSYGFHSQDDLLDGLDLSIKPGQTVAITGRSGEGKTTLTHLLMRFLDPTQGQVLLDGIDIADIKLTNLRSKIGLVQQQVLIVDGTVAENIAFGHSSADMDDVRAAAKAAHALDFIFKLPQGFDTLIGEQGIKLSGGQRQRLSLARALLKSPPVLILDEASAMFDQKSEQNFLKECHQVLYSCTVILITNRPDSLVLADRVFTLVGGRLQDMNAGDLASLNGTYGPG